MYQSTPGQLFALCHTAAFVGCAFPSFLLSPPQARTVVKLGDCLPHVMYAEYVTPMGLLLVSMVLWILCLLALSGLPCCVWLAVSVCSNVDPLYLFPFWPLGARWLSGLTPGRNKKKKRTCTAVPAAHPVGSSCHPPGERESVFQLSSHMADAGAARTSPGRS